LHLKNFRISDGKAATAMAEHGVGFVQLLDAAHHGLDIDLQIARQFFLLGTLVRTNSCSGGSINRIVTGSRPWL